MLNEKDVEQGKQKDLDNLGIAKNAREEKIPRSATPSRRRIEKSAQDVEMEKLYRKHILKEPEPEPGFVPLGSIAPAAKKKTEESREEVGSFGD